MKARLYAVLTGQPARLIVSIVVAMTVLSSSAAAFTVGKPAPELAGDAWINSKRLTLKDLRNRVVLVEFWTYG